MQLGRFGVWHRPMPRPREWRNGSKIRSIQRCGWAAHRPISRMWMNCFRNSDVVAITTFGSLAEAE